MNWNDNDRDLKTIIHQPLVKHNSWIDGVLVPGAQCLITGTLAGFCAAVIAGLAGAVWWKWGLGTASLITLISWVTFRADWSARLEKMLGIDLNLDGQIGPAPAPAAEHIRIDLVQDGDYPSGQFIDLPAPAEKIRALASGLATGREFSQTVWIGSGGIFSRSEFDRLRDELIRRGLAVWKNPDHHAQGAVLTSAGKAVMRKLASHPPTLEADNHR